MKKKPIKNNLFDSNLRIVVDGIIYTLQKAGGISRLYNEIMPRICNHDEGISFQILLNNRNIQLLPHHKHITSIPTYKLESLFHPWRFWKNYAPQVKQEFTNALIGDSTRKIWHSTYFTLPERWKGATVVTVYDMIYELLREPYFSSAMDDEFRSRKRNAILQADKIIAISQTTKEDLISILGVADEKIQVIYLGCSPIFQKIDCSQEPGKPFILYIGDRRNYKNFDGLLQAYSLLQEKRSIDLVVVGQDWSEEELNRLGALDLSEKVRLIPYPDDITLRDLFNQAMAFVHPSFYEGFGLPLVEAMSCGCPVVASRIPSTVEIAGEVPIYHEPGNLEQLLANLDQAYDESRSSMRTSLGIKLAKSFSWDRTAQQTADLYHALIC